MTEPPMPNPQGVKKGHNIQVPPMPLRVMVIDDVNGFITTYELVNTVTREIPRNQEAIDSQITAARLLGTLVVQRIHTNEHWLMPVPDYSDDPKRWE